MVAGGKMVAKGQSIPDGQVQRGVSGGGGQVRAPQAAAALNCCLIQHTLPRTSSLRT